MYDDILVPTDGSEQALAAARHAFELAGVHGATVHGLYVVETDTGWLTVSKDELRAAFREVGEDAGEQALSALEPLAAEFDVELVTELREGTPDKEILAYADSRGVDLVVMGTHGRAGLRSRLLGSITERVVREATVPVMTVGETDDDAP